MGRNRSSKLVVVEVRWEQKPGNGWLLRQVFDLLLRDPGSTRRDPRLPIEPEAVLDEKEQEL